MGNFDQDDIASIKAEIRFAEHGTADFDQWAGELATRPGIARQAVSTAAGIARQAVRYSPPALVIRYLGW